jgi:hypothetical protein
MGVRFTAVRGRQQRLPLRNTVGNIQDVTVERLSISFDDDLADQVRRHAAARGTTISGWLADAARNQLRHDGWDALFADWEAEHGAFTEEELREARAELGLPLDGSAER